MDGGGGEAVFEKAHYIVLDLKQLIFPQKDM